MFLDCSKIDVTPEVFSQIYAKPIFKDTRILKCSVKNPVMIRVFNIACSASVPNGDIYI